MNKLKFYMRTKGKIKEQAETYARVFKGKVLKHSFINTQDHDKNLGDNPGQEYNFAYVNIVNDVNLLLALHKQDMPAHGYQGNRVLTLDDKDLYLEDIENLSNDQNFSVVYGSTKYNYSGGIIIAKFMDKWNNGWVIEVKDK